MMDKIKLTIIFLFRVSLLLSVYFLVGSLHVHAKQHVYFGTGRVGGDGIYYATFDDSSGDLSKPVRVANIPAPGFLAAHPHKRVLYAVAGDINSPEVVAYSMLENGDLELINKLNVGGRNAAHIAVHPSGRFLLTAQYGGGSVAVFSLSTDGKLNKREQLIQHEGASKAYKNRQNSPHPHWVGFSPDGRYAFVPDLGKDKVVVYSVSGKAKISFHREIDIAQGSGPRHMRFSIDGRYIYLLNELTMSISVFAYDDGSAKTRHVAEVPALSEELKRQESFNSSSEILVHPSGKFVYSGNRGNDTVSVFAVDTQARSLTFVEHEPVRGAFPRNINLDLTGGWLLAAGQHSNTISVFSVDHASGKLKYKTNSVKNVPEPTCILFSK